MSIPRFTIRAFAVVCVAVTSAYVMWMGYRVNETLSGPGWCATALGAGKASSTDGAPIKGLEACVGLLTIQLKTMSTNSHILFGSIALCLCVLIIIVIAGAKFTGEAPGGFRADVSPADDPVPVTVTNAPSDPVPVTPPGPAMPPPPGTQP